MVYIVVYIDFCYPFFCQNKLYIKKIKTILFVDIYVKRNSNRQTNIKHNTKSVTCMSFFLDC